MNAILNDLAPIKTMRVRDTDVPFMTSEWKRAIRAKRRATAKFLKNKTQENWELKRKARNEATKQRRIAIREYWKKKAQDLKTRPRDFFKTFRPFLNTKGNAKNGEIKLIVDGTLVRDQKKVAEVFVSHFATIADDIGGTGAQLSSTDDFDNHPSIQRIRQERKDFTTISDVTPVTQGHVKTVLESLDTNKATGCDGIPAKIMRIGAEELSQPLADLFNSCIRNVYGRATGSVVFGLLFTKKRISVLKKTTDPLRYYHAWTKCLSNLLACKCQLPFKLIFMNNPLPIEKHIAVKRP